MFVDKDQEFDSLLVVVIVVSVIAIVAIIAGVILHIKQRAVIKRLYIVFVFYVVIPIMDVALLRTYQQKCLVLCLQVISDIP